MPNQAQFLIEILRKEAAVDCIDADVTTALLGDKAQQPAEATIFTRQRGVFAGEVFKGALEELQILQMPAVVMACDGQEIVENQAVLKLRSTLGTCLSWERTLLNTLSLMCGVATLTREFVRRTEGTKAKILATRKTLPGLKALQLYAVECGGGHIHRRNLSDGILVKDNHLQFMSPQEAVARAQKTRSPLHGIEVEVDSLEKLKNLLPNLPDVVMLDNMTQEQMQEALGLIQSRCRVEISGGVNLENVSKWAQLGVDYISVGALTHSAPGLNLSMDIQKVGNYG